MGRRDDEWVLLNWLPDYGRKDYFPFPSIYIVDIRNNRVSQIDFPAMPKDLPSYEKCGDSGVGMNSIKKLIDGSKISRIGFGGGNYRDCPIYFEIDFRKMEGWYGFSIGN